jgi:hypothetical protein
MGLVQVATNTVTSAVSSVTLTGINSDDVYMVTVNNLVASASNTIDIQFTVGGTADTSSNYDLAAKNLWSGGSFANNVATNGSDIAYGNTIGSSTNQFHNAILYLYNFNNSSEYSLITIEETANNSNGIGRQGCGVLKEAQATDGVLIKAGTGNINSGTFTLYKVV